MLRGLKMSFVFNFVLRLLCISYLPKVVLSIVHALYFKKLPDPKNRNILWVIDWFYVCLNLYNSKRFMWEARMTMRTTDDDDDDEDEWIWNAFILFRRFLGQLSFCEVRNDESMISLTLNIELVAVFCHTKIPEKDETHRTRSNIATTNNLLSWEIFTCPSSW